MSGGHYEYIQYRMNDAAGQLKQDLANIKKNAEMDLDKAKQEGLTWAYGHTLDLMKLASLMLERCDWLESADDGVESFFENSIDDLSELTLKTKEGRDLRNKIIKHMSRALFPASSRVEE